MCASPKNWMRIFLKPRETLNYAKFWITLFLKEGFEDGHGEFQESY